MEGQKHQDWKVWRPLRWDEVRPQALIEDEGGRPLFPKHHKQSVEISEDSPLDLKDFTAEAGKQVLSEKAILFS